MIRKIALTGLVVVGILLGVAGYLRLQGAAIPGLPLPALPASLSAAAAASDSATVAAAARERCRLTIAGQKRACYEDILLELTRRGQVRVAMGALNLLGQTDAGIRRIGHDYSHVIGINAWKPGKDIGAVYRECTELFQSGCYHGVIQAFFAYTGTDSASTVALCRDTPGISDNTWLRFQCVHGIGHGLVQTYAMNLPRALIGCDRLGNAWDAESCYGGAFMEFIVGGRGQSHHVHTMPAAGDSAAGAAGEHAMAGMDHGAMDHSAMGRRPLVPDSLPPFKVRDKSDPLFPCSVLGERYQRSCYGMQAGLAAEIVGLDFAKIAKVCDLAPEPMRRSCYQGIGTYVSGVTNRDPVAGIRDCSLGARSYQPFCFVGLVKNYVDVTANPDDGLAFCRRLGPVDIATACYVAVGEEAAVLYAYTNQKEQACARAESAYREACRYGARVSTERPKDLPGG